VVAILIGFNVARIRQLWLYLFGGIALWYFVRQSGVHATVAGVMLAFIIPTHRRINAVQFSREARALVNQFDRGEIGDFLVLTSKRQQKALFALKHAMAAVFLGVKSGIAEIPATLGWTSLLGYAWLAGIGFTLSLLIAMLAVRRHCEPRRSETWHSWGITACRCCWGDHS
jgi:NhaA family Na+:H+ antiporter